jgi:hypothetical protein
MTEEDRLLATCPDCGGKAEVVGGFNAIDHIQCGCGYTGEQFEENGIVYNLKMPIEDGMAWLDAWGRCVEETNARNVRDSLQSK